MASPVFPVITRRRLLASMAGVAAAGAATVAGPSAAAAVAGGATTTAIRKLPLSVVNNSGSFKNGSVHLYVVGTQGNHQVHVDRQGVATPIKLSDNHVGGFTDYSIPLAASGATNLRLPYMSGRIYVALGGKLKFKVVKDAAGNLGLQAPAGWVDSDPNFGVLYDVVEFTYDASGMHCNTTTVDMFAVPMSLRLAGAKVHTAGTLRAGGRAQVFRAMRNHQDFAHLVVGDHRVIAPGHGLDSGRFPQHYFDAYIDDVWKHYQNTDLVVRTVAGTFRGRVQGGRLAFTGPAALSFAKPSTRDVLYCDGALQAPNDGARGPVAAVLGAGFNRSTLLSHATQPTTQASAFYRTPVTNHYAAALHAAASNGKAYGFAFDDVAGWSSYIEDGAPKSLRLTISPF